VTERPDRQQPDSFVASLDPVSLRGARIGVIPDRVIRDPGDEEVAAVFEAAMLDLQAAGTSVIRLDDQPQISGRLTGGLINHEFKFHLNDYLTSLGPDAPQRTLAQIIDSGLTHPAVTDALRAAESVPTLDTSDYRATLQRFADLAVAIRQLLDEHRLDALAYPTMRRPPQPLGHSQPGMNCRMSAYSGLPALSVPMGRTPDGLPVGLELLGRPFSEARLLSLGHAFEQSTAHRLAPASTPPLPPSDAATTVVHRLAGSDRVATGIAIAHDAYVDAAASESPTLVVGARRAHAVVVAAADAFADALVAGPLAVAVDGPLLLCDGDHLESRVLAEIQRVLGTGGDVHLVGGSAVIAPAVDQALDATGYRVHRHAGRNRFATAVDVAAAVAGNGPAVIVADGAAFADALAAGPAAARTGAALLLSDGQRLPPETGQWLDQHRHAEVLAVGGPAAAALPAAESIVGIDRVDTAVRLARRVFADATVAGLGSADTFADALVGGAHAARQDAPLLLAFSAGTTDALEGWLAEQSARLEVAYIYGGLDPVESGVVAHLEPAVVNR
jgi:putative cell wall-binding protein